MDGRNEMYIDIVYFDYPVQMYASVPCRLPIFASNSLTVVRTGTYTTFDSISAKNIMFDHGDGDSE